jgi:uncharacterized membrane protein
MEINKTNRVVITFIIIAISLVIATIVLPILIFNSWLPLRINDFNEIGDAFGGIVNPMIAAVGVTLTFLAFYIQYQANQQQLKQINDSKNEQNNLLKQQMFFKLMDNQQQRIYNFSERNYGLSNSKPDTVGITAFNSFVDKYLKEDKLLVEVSESIFKSNPSRIGVYRLKELLLRFQFLFNNKNINSIVNEFKTSENISVNNFLSKSLDLLEQNKEENLTTIFKSIGFHYFFEADKEIKEKIYKSILEKAKKYNAVFIDGYCKGFEHIINLLKEDALVKNNTFIDYLKYNLTIGEQKILFLYFASGNGKPETKLFILEKKLFSDLCNEYFLSDHEDNKALMESEVRAILSN